MTETQQQKQKANNATDLLRKAIAEAEERSLYGEVVIKLSMQNGKIGHYERTIRETYK